MNSIQNCGVANYQLRNNKNVNFNGVGISKYLQRKLSKELINPHHRDVYMEKLKRRLNNIPVNIIIQNIVVQTKRKVAYITLTCGEEKQIITVSDNNIMNLFDDDYSKSKMDILEHLWRRGRKGPVRLKEYAEIVFPQRLLRRRDLANPK